MQERKMGEGGRKEQRLENAELKMQDQSSIITDKECH